MHVNEKRSGRSSSDRHVRLNYSILTLPIVSVVLRPSAMIDLNTIDVEGYVRQAPFQHQKRLIDQLSHIYSLLYEYTQFTLLRALQSSHSV